MPPEPPVLAGLIIAVPTMVCGVHGMNFDHMPELRRR